MSLLGGLDEDASAAAAGLARVASFLALAGLSCAGRI